MKQYIELSPLDVALAAGLVFAAGLVSALFRLGLSKRLAVGALRTALQLGIAGAALELVFGMKHVILVLLLAAGMIFLAGREAIRRQAVRLSGVPGDTLLAMAVSSFVVAVIVTGVVVGAKPWWAPQFFIPLLGMILGNSLNGISLALDRFLTSCATRRREIEARLALGATAAEASRPFLRDAVRTGMTPIINAMAIVGLVSLPGMMTGQLLAGADPRDAVLYQIVVMYMLVAAVAIGSVLAVLLARRRVFTRDMALRQDLEAPREL